MERNLIYHELKSSKVHFDVIYIIMCKSYIIFKTFYSMIKSDIIENHRGGLTFYLEYLLIKNFWSKEII